MDARGKASPYDRLDRRSRAACCSYIAQNEPLPTVHWVNAVTSTLPGQSVTQPRGSIPAAKQLNTQLHAESSTHASTSVQQFARMQLVQALSLETGMQGSPPPVVVLAPLPPMPEELLLAPPLLALLLALLLVAAPLPPPPIEPSASPLDRTSSPQATNSSPPPSNSIHVRRFMVSRIASRPAAPGQARLLLTT